MGKIVNFNVDILEEAIIPVVEKCFNYLDVVADTIDSIKPPDDFEHAGELRMISGALRGNEEYITNINFELEDMVKTFKAAENKNRNILINLLFRGSKTDSVINFFSDFKLIPSEIIPYMAEIVHDEQKNWIYYSDYMKKKGCGDGLKYKDIVSSINNPNGVTCCATYVSAVLYKTGYFTEEEINKIGYNSANGLRWELARRDWEFIEKDKELLQPGDIVFTTKKGKTKHVQIYMGNNSWYTSGNTEDIQSEGVIVNPEWEKEWDGWIAYRPPTIEIKEKETVEAKL